MKTIKKKPAAKKTAVKKSAKKSATKSLTRPAAKKAVKKASAKVVVKKKTVQSAKKNTPSKAAPATKKPVVKANTPQSKKNKEQKNFPGYPLYAPSEDIMNRAKRTEADLDYPKGSPKIAKDQPTIDTDADEQAILKQKPAKSKGPNDVTKDDLKALGDDELEMDGGDDEELRNRATPVDFSGSDLDVPEDDDDKSNNEAGSEDEENKTYSLGGDDHDDLEEDKA